MLLLADPFEVQLRQKPIEWMPRRFWPLGTQSASATVVFLTRSAEQEVTDLCRVLDRVGLAAVRVDADTVERPEAAALGVELMRRGDRLIVWPRSYDGFGYSCPPTPIGRYREDVWRTVAADLVAGAALSIVPLGGLTRWGQVRCAAKMNVLVPRTTVTVCPDADPDVGCWDRVVLKPLGDHFVEHTPGSLNGAMPIVRSRSDLAGVRTTVPILAQEYVDGVDLRVFLVGEMVIAYRVHKSSIEAPWTEPGSVDVSLIEPARTTVSAVRALARCWNLAYGAFDFRSTPHGDYFLEVNPTGSWRWFETRSGTKDVTRAAARLLIGHARTLTDRAR